MLLSSLLARILVLVSVVYATRDVVITGSKVDKGPINLSIGDITIEENSYWSIFDNSVSALKGSLWVKKGAGFYITGTDRLINLSVTLAFGQNSIKNEGTVVFNSIFCKLATKYELIGSSFYNSGEMFLATNGALGSLTAITSSSWTNSGLLVFYQNSRTSAIVSLGKPLGTIRNDGQICLHNELFKQETNIVGSGCITADKNSSIFLSNCLLEIDPKQSFYLADSQSSIRAKAISKSKTYTVYGFGNGNKIGLDLPLISLPILGSWGYDEKRGILTLRALGNLAHNFIIGTGYDKKKFQITTDSSLGLLSVFNGALKYNGPVPNSSIPSACRPCKPVPSVPDGPHTTSQTTAKTPCTTSTKKHSTRSSKSCNSQITVTSTWTEITTTTVTIISSSVEASCVPSYITVTVTTTAEPIDTVTVTSCPTMKPPHSTDTIYTVTSVYITETTTTTARTTLPTVTVTETKTKGYFRFF
ncbi:hyphally regulated cell wall protein [Scheffersomyces stipitis CBS 6054]|uniref:Hyphally regulated cell wall protein n=1 Tax=Scheffersomyces stipitis (strain ATCC 58785 / CBS 6054 / NBRC 10063 / NRRL Y-11545) TaxID=322104 RepID=A3LYL1_PICST|nr:hyphally regulated cell wall protein [Scheffersomyces stipitis CBS 6054]ABN68189.2 hyphally regulated cell wall protein [Scheffersomyces stipitis CBS 6054]